MQLDFCSRVLSTRMALMFCVLVQISWSTPVGAGDVYVHQEVGSNDNPGSLEKPLATIQAAIKLAQPGDTVHLQPADSLYRQSFHLSGKWDLTIEGNNVTLDGADPLPETGWEPVTINLHRRLVARNFDDRYQLLIAGKPQQMGHSASRNSRMYPSPEQLQPGEFAILPHEEKTVWLYVCGPLQDLEWTVRTNGLATGGNNENITVRNLNARHFLNDGFNIHGHAYGLIFEKITGYECIDEGFSAHEDSQCKISDSKFWGNDNAIADVNDCETHYLNCEFSQSVGNDVLLIGKKHSLTNCRIINSTPATALAAGPRGLEKKLYQLRLDRLTVVCTRPAAKARVRIDGGQLELIGCQWDQAEVNLTGAVLID